MEHQEEPSGPLFSPSIITIIPSTSSSSSSFFSSFLHHRHRGQYFQQTFATELKVDMSYNDRGAQDRVFSSAEMTALPYEAGYGNDRRHDRLDSRSEFSWESRYADHRDRDDSRFYVRPFERSREFAYHDRQNRDELDHRFRDAAYYDREQELRYDDRNYGGREAGKDERRRLPSNSRSSSPSKRPRYHDGDRTTDIISSSRDYGRYPREPPSSRSYPTVPRPDDIQYMRRAVPEAYRSPRRLHDADYPPRSKSSADGLLDQLKKDPKDSLLLEKLVQDEVDKAMKVRSICCGSGDGC